MASFGKKILSAFVDIEEDDSSKQPTYKEVIAERPVIVANDTINAKFKTYFEQLFSEANLPGPGYYEFSKMVEAMMSLPDERTRYLTAFAGLSVQGLDKSKLVKSAQQYMQILNNDAENFNNTINATLHEKVEMKKQQLEEKSRRINDLTREISDLNNEIAAIGNEIKENEEKIGANVSGYNNELERFKAKISDDVNKINQMI
jgi:uncharacterized protein YoxC